MSAVSLLDQSRKIASTVWKIHQKTHFELGRPKAFSSARIVLSSSKQEFLIVIPDFPLTTEQRRKAQPKHIEAAMPLIKSGDLSYFGVTMRSGNVVDQDYSPRTNGSAIVLKAENEQAVKDYLLRDSYTIAGVWDVEKAQIWAFKSG